MKFPAEAFVAQKVQDTAPGSLLTMNGNWWLRVQGMPSLPHHKGMIQLVGPNAGTLTPINTVGRYLSIPRGPRYGWVPYVEGPAAAIAGGLISASISIVGHRHIIWGASSPDFFSPYDLDGQLVDDTNIEPSDGIRFPIWKAMLVNMTDQRSSIAEIVEIKRQVTT